jgi:ATP adenylyltransferase
MSGNQTLVDLDNAREEEQVQVMEQLLADDACPFCEEKLGKYHRQDILRTGKYWLLTKNQWPYENTKHHLLLIYRGHVVDLSEAEPAAGQELLEMAQWAQQQFNITGGGLVLRFGDTNFSAGSVQHLHAQLVQPDLAAENYQPVRIKLGKSPEKLKDYQ